LSDLDRELISECKGSSGVILGLILIQVVA
jgi:hypothetical protein